MLREGPVQLETVSPGHGPKKPDDEKPTQYKRAPLKE
jgi:hypothetical protein